MILLNAELNEWLKEWQFPMEMKATRATRHTSWYQGKSVSIDRGCLLLQTECGKHIHVFHNIQVKNTLNKNERKFLLETILIPWLITHERIIKDIVAFREQTPFEKAELAMATWAKKYTRLEVADSLNIRVKNSEGHVAGTIRFTPHEEFEDTMVSFKPANVPLNGPYPEQLQETINTLHYVKKLPLYELRQTFYNTNRQQVKDNEHLDHCLELLAGVCEL